MSEAIEYGVSFGNGNDGVSQMYPSYIVKTDRPYDLALAAVLGEFKPGEGVAFAKENVMIDGEADFTIYAMILEGPDGETEFGAAWFCCEVYPAEDAVSDSSSAPRYESLEECFSAEVLAHLEERREAVRAANQMSARYHVIVGNIGTVEETDDENKAITTATEYAEAKYGRGAGEPVTILDNVTGDIVAEWPGQAEDEEY